jgi:hypothetical protein
MASSSSARSATRISATISSGEGIKYLVLATQRKEVKEAFQCNPAARFDGRAGKGLAVAGAIDAA